VDPGKISKYSFLKGLSLLKLSVSSIGTFEKCPKKYHYRYIEKPDVVRNKWDFTEFGSCAHLILELFHKVLLKKHVPPSRYPDLMKWSFNKAIKEFDIDILNGKIWSPDGDKNGIEFLKEICQSYLNKIRKEGLPNVIGVETSYNFEIDDASMIRGFIDRIDKIDDKTYHVIDYKTSKNEKYLNEFQVLVYAEAVKRMYPDAEKIIGSYMLLKHEMKMMSWTFTADDLDRCNKQIRKQSSLITEETTWLKKPSILCRWCDYKDLCQNSWTD
tara:strand:+ start:528 stop:1340 length:813 start_codon:yes stop_codon:yes gene_type:complete